jgi:hypothetical protein
MKTNICKIASLAALMVIFFQANVCASANKIKEVYANQNFKIEERNDIIHVAIDKNPWESFTFAVDNFEIINNPIVNLQISTNQSITLRADLTDGNFMSSEIQIVSHQVEASKSFTQLSFDFSDIISNLHLNELVYLVFYLNPGSDFTGELAIQNFNLSTEADQQATLSQISGFKMFPSPATSYTNIEIPEGGFNRMQLIDMSGKVLGDYDISGYDGMSYRLELGHLSPAYYTVQILSDDLRISEKLIIN